MAKLIVTIKSNLPELEDLLKRATEQAANFKATLDEIKDFELIIEPVNRDENRGAD